MVDGRNHPRNDRAHDPLGVLRRAVDELHRAVDDRSLLGAPGLDVHRYGTALVALARVLPAVEGDLIRSARDRMPVAALTPLLLDDVDRLGRADELEHDAPGCIGVDDPGAWWGAMYVLQGSRLGATVIADRLATDLPSAPRRYFVESARGAAPAWASFRTAARAALSPGGADLERASIAARTVFDALLAEFDRLGMQTPRTGRVA